MIACSSWRSDRGCQRGTLPACGVEAIEAVGEAGGAVWSPGGGPRAERVSRQRRMVSSHAFAAGDRYASSQLLMTPPTIQPACGWRSIRGRQVCHSTVIGIAFCFAASVFGRLTVKTPLAKVALTLSAATGAGSRTIRANAP
jgi:hypothetical protein